MYLQTLQTLLHRNQIISQTAQYDIVYKAGESQRWLEVKVKVGHMPSF